MVIDIPRQADLQIDPGCGCDATRREPALKP